MNLWIRLAYALLSWRFRAKLDWQAVGRRNLRVWPTDLDGFRHMNNGIFLSLLDLSRLDLAYRSGAWQKWKKHGWYPVVVAETITFRKSLMPWQKFAMESKVIGWDDQAVFVEQRFTRNGEVYTKAIVKLRWLKNPRGIVTPQEVIDAGGGWPGKVPTLPDWVVQWNADSSLPKGKEPAPSTWD